MVSGIPRGYPAFRLEYIRQELEHGGLITDWSDEALISRFINVVAHALYGPIHEGRRFGFGAIVVQGSWPSYHEDAGRPTVVSRASSSEAADGRSSFLVSDCRELPRIVVFEHELTSELALFDLRDTVIKQHGGNTDFNDFWIVVRDNSGCCRIFATTGIATIRGGHWEVRRYQYALGAIQALLSRGWLRASGSGLVQTARDTDEGRLVRAILRIGVHMLGETGSGATFLLLPRGEESESSILAPGVLNFDRANPLNNFTIDYESAIVLAQLVRQRDGIVVVQADDETHGRALWESVFSVAEVPSGVSMATFGGARQLSAQALSSALSDAVVVSISSDGPVRVWHQGEVVAANYDDLATWTLPAV